MLVTHFVLDGNLLGLWRIEVAPNHIVFLVYTLELLLVSVEFFLRRLYDRIHNGIRAWYNSKVLISAIMTTKLKD